MKVNIGKFPKNAHRRIKVDIEKFDTYNVDHTLALIILPMLLQFRETHHGLPNEFVDTSGEDYHRQQSFDFYRDSQESFDKAIERWHNILDKMIWSFYQIIIDDDRKYHHGSPSYASIKQSDGMYRMIDKNPDDHWYDSVGHQMYEDRIKEGLELFGKYYKSLWD